MDVDTVQAILGPVLTALVTGIGIAVRQWWQSRDARQRAHRRLGDASAEIAFIREWVAAAAEVGSAEQTQQSLARARRDLQTIYDQLFADLNLARIQSDQESGWTFDRVFNAAVALKVPVGVEPVGAAASPIPRQSTGPLGYPVATKARVRYRRPIGIARIVRPLYWLSLAWALLWTMSSFVTVPFLDDVGGIVGGTLLALVSTLVLGVLPAAAVRAFVLYLDERATEHLLHEESDQPTPTGLSSEHRHASRIGPGGPRLQVDQDQEDAQATSPGVSAPPVIP